jgi:hypothetical protein
MSEMDRNYKDYGYYFPNSEKNYFSWHKDDTDINSYSQAEAIAKEINLKLPHKINRGDLYTSSFNDSRLKDREKNLDLTDQEYQDLIRSINFTELFKETVTRDYFNPLIKLLS